MVLAQHAHELEAGAHLGTLPSLALAVDDPAVSACTPWRVDAARAYAG
jgi:hypothetical protein